IGMFLVGAIAIVASQWRRVRVTEMESSLKQQMLDRGMSAADIEQVMNAGKKKTNCWSEAVFTGNAAIDKATLVKTMAENGYDGKDIERVLKAFQEQPGRGHPVAELAAVASKMVQNWNSAEEIEQVLKAYDHQPNRDKAR